MSIEKIEAIFGPDVSKLDDELEENERETKNDKMKEEDPEEKNLVSENDGKEANPKTEDAHPIDVPWRIKGERLSVKYYIGQRKILINLILMSLIWTIVSFTYSLLTLHIKYIPGDFSLNQFAMSATDIPACLIAGQLVLVCKPRIIFMSFFLLATVASFCLVLFADAKNPGAMMSVCIILVRLGLTAAFCSVYMNHPKMFPTLFAATSIGITNLFARSIMIFAPFVAEISYPTPMIIFTILCLMAFVSSYFILDLNTDEQKSDENRENKPIK